MAPPHDAIAEAVAEWKRGSAGGGDSAEEPEDVGAYATRLPNLLNVILVDPEGDLLWAIHAQIDLQEDTNPEGSLLRLDRIGP